MARIKNKQDSTFIGSTVVGIKEIKKTVYSKRKGKQVEVTEHRGSVTLSDGTGIALKISKTSDEKYKSTGKSYWVEVAEFAPKGSHGGR